MKVKLLYTEFEADGTTGRIQVGEVPGAIAQVTVPAFWVPLASAGTVPIPPGTDTAPPWGHQVVALLFSVSPVIRSAPSRGAGSQAPKPHTARFPAHPCRLMPSRPVSYRCYELAEA